MSSLVTSASLWNNDDTNQNTTKKRVSTIRKTQKQRTFSQLATDKDSEEATDGHMESYQNLQPYSLSDTQTSMDNRNVRINDLLNKITSVDAQPENNKLGAFTPISLPEVQVKKDSPSNILPKQYIPEPPSYANASISNKTPNMAYGADDTKVGGLSNYTKSYVPPPTWTTTNAPYYAKMGLGNAAPDDKMMDKINYMIHLLDQQQNEKTSHITEEFVLYMFLGVFIIYVVDSFSRTGKYVR
jgi:hypothetical protein